MDFIFPKHNQKYKHNLTTIQKLSTIKHNIIEPYVNAVE